MSIDLLTDEDIRLAMTFTVDQMEAFRQSIPPALWVEFVERVEQMAPPPKPWEPMAHQVPPPNDEAWYGWLLLGGRGAGKTAAVTHWLNDHANGPPCLDGPVPHRMGIIAPTLGDASASIVHGDDGLAVINPEVREITRKGGTVALWPNGAFAFLLGVNTLKDVDRLRAHGNRCADVREEVAAWPYLREGLAQADFGLRKGLARWVGATTPRPRPSIRKLNASPIVRISTATTDDNVHLTAEKRQMLYDEFGGTRVGLQELEGKILEDVSGALWTQDLIEQYRVTIDEVPRLLWVRTYVDPSWGTTNDECGIIVMGRGADGHAYVLGDLSKRTTPTEWGKLAALGYLPSDEQVAASVDDDGNPIPLPLREWVAGEGRLRVSEMVKAEGNFQGEQVRLVMKTISALIHRRIRFKLINVSKGKRLRAEPVLALYEQGKVHHVGHLPGLEFQLTSWVPPEAGEDAGDPGDPEELEATEEGQDPSNWSPDRLDACVFGVTDALLTAGSGTGTIEVADGRIPKVSLSSRTPTGPTLGGIPASTRQAAMLRRQLGEDG